MRSVCGRWGYAERIALPRRYLDRMPKITPLAAIPVTAPSSVAAASIATLPPGQILWVEGRVSAGSVGLRPYYWAPETTSTTGIGGAWVPLGGDAVAGTNPVSFNAASFGGCAQGAYDFRRVQSQVVLVEESPVGLTIDFVHISSELAVAPV